MHAWRAGTLAYADSAAAANAAGRRRPDGPGVCLYYCLYYCRSTVFTTVFTTANAAGRRRPDGPGVCVCVRARAYT